MSTMSFVSARPMAVSASSSSYTSAPSFVARKAVVADAMAGREEATREGAHVRVADARRWEAGKRRRLDGAAAPAPAAPQTATF